MELPIWGGTLLPFMFWQRLHFAAWTALVLLLGYSLGAFALLMEEVGAPAPITVLPHDIHRRAPFVRVQEINDGRIIGTVGTGARLMIGDAVIVPHPNRTFAIDAAPFLVNIINVPVPRGTAYVASRKGKNYYPVDSSAGQKLTPENRLYFRSAAEAEAMGYVRGK